MPRARATKGRTRRPPTEALKRIRDAEVILRDHLTLDTRLRRRTFRHERSRNLVIAGLDVIGDSTLAIHAFLRNMRRGLDYLRIYGVLQALTIQREAVRRIAREVRCGYRPAGDDAAVLRAARMVRIQIAGHPTLSKGRADAEALTDDDTEGEEDLAPRGSEILWSHQVARHSIGGGILEIHSRASTGATKQEALELCPLVVQHSVAIASWLQAVNRHLADDVVAHRRKFRSEKLTELVFPEVLTYGIELLAREASAGSLDLSRSVLADLRTRIADLKRRLAERGTPLDRLPFVRLEVGELEHDLGELERFAARAPEAVVPKTATVLAEHVKAKVDSLRRICAEMDATYGSDDPRQ